MTHPDFGGASVTYPHKLRIRSLLHSISPRAEKIGAVNTVVVREVSDERRLLGDNTDWEGIKACVLKSGVDLKGKSALVLGAGGAARAAVFAVQEMGIMDVVVNRTRAKAEDMVKDFDELRFRVCGSLGEVCSSGERGSRVVIACVPTEMGWVRRRSRMRCLIELSLGR
jgi:shikimate 5-dehydrogenase